MDTKWRNRDWLYRHYIIREESTTVVAQKAGCGHEAIRRWLHRYEIPVRSRGEGIFLAKRNFVDIIPNLLKFMGGEIIGDGSVRMTSNRSAGYSHGSKYEEYLVWLSGRFDKWGIEQSGQINGCKDKKTGAIVYHYESKSYPELIDVYKCWYPNGKKAVPKDLKLSPIMARQWYLGDGGLSNYKTKRPGIVFSTNSFDRQSIEHLIAELRKQGFRATHWPASNKIYLSVYSTRDFLKWIGPCPIACYDYKWDYSGSGTGRDIAGMSKAKTFTAMAE